jgi:AraC family transcriptional regulator
MSQLDSMYAAVEFIEANLKQPIGVADMAESVAYSLYHFCRTFNATVRHTPYDYLMRRRLTESAHQLVETDRKIIDIAGDYGFNNPETYSRAFKRMFEMQPSQWRKRGLIEVRRLMPSLSLAYLEHINRGKTLKPVLVEKEAFQIAGLMTLMEGDRAVVEKLWGILVLELGRMEIEPEKYTGITWYPDDWQESGYFYLAGVEVTSPDISNSALVVKWIPASKYACFIHKGSSQSLPFTLDYIYHTWLPKSGEKLAYPFEIEEHGVDFRDWEHERVERGVYIPIE